MVQGEISNLNLSASGHCYFSLFDEQALISCAFFKMDYLRSSFSKKAKNGEKIIVIGDLSVYPKRGQFQLIVKRILPIGEGLLKYQFEQLKTKLSQEGLFDLEKKKKIPLYPNKIAVVTSETGAAIHDFLNVLKRRSLWFDVVLIPSIVQGESAPESLIKAIRKAQNLNPLPDVLVVTRGGGSLEDLWAFNNESLVREIFNCSIPTISAIGHQVDFTLCDYVSDFRAETPTAAAETLSQAQTEILSRINFCRTHLNTNLKNLSQNIELSLKKFHPREILNKILEILQNNHHRLRKVALDQTNFKINLVTKNRETDELLVKLSYLIESIKNKNLENLKRFDEMLKVLNPNNTLNRGYTYIRGNSGKIINSLKNFKDLKEKEEIQVVFFDGTGRALKGGP